MAVDSYARQLAVAALQNGGGSGSSGITDAPKDGKTYGRKNGAWSALNYIDQSSSQTISGVKTFTVLPQTSVTPSANTDMTNKQYVDNAISTAITGALEASY